MRRQGATPCPSRACRGSIFFQQFGLPVRNTASLSRCHRYRYALWRSWDDTRPQLMFIGLNPSTADARHDDPTLIRCMRFASDWGYGAVCMGNLFAWRATDPGQIRKVDDPVGPRNDHWLRRLAGESTLVVAAWGNDGNYRQRATRVRKMLPDMRCLKMNRGGEPAHPLYQPATARPQPLASADE